MDIHGADVKNIKVKLPDDRILYVPSRRFSFSSAVHNLYYYVQKHWAG